MSGPDREPPPDPDSIAAEYVLGVLEADEMEDVRSRSRTDLELAAAISAWEDRLFGLGATLPPVAPPPALWSRIERAVAPAGSAVSNGAAAPVRRPSSVAALPDRRAARWQVVAGGMGALAAFFAAIAFLPNPKPPEPVRVAALTPVGAVAAAFVTTARPDGTVTVAPVALPAVPANRELELWILPPGATRVASLGTIPSQGRMIHLPSLPASGTQLLVSLEPRGGSPTGQPTGPVLYAGTLTTS